MSWSWTAPRPSLAKPKRFWLSDVFAPRASQGRLARSVTRRRATIATAPTRRPRAVASVVSNASLVTTATTARSVSRATTSPLGKPTARKVSVKRDVWFWCKLQRLYGFVCLIGLVVVWFVLFCVGVTNVLAMGGWEERFVVLFIMVMKIIREVHRMKASFDFMMKLSISRPQCLAALIPVSFRSTENPDDENVYFGEDRNF